MIRCFDEHDVRPCDSLDGRWEFITDQDHTADGLPEQYARTVQVPGAWELIPGLENHRGRAWYRTVIHTDEGHHVRLVFGGVSHTATIYVDGEQVGEHYDAFTPFAVVIPNLADGEHELVIEVDNRFGENSALHIENDYYSYGGITRPVMIEWIGDCYLEHASYRTRRDGDDWVLDASVTIANIGEDVVTTGVVVGLPETGTQLGSVAIPPGESVILEGSIIAKEVESWAPGSPFLYPVAALLVDADGEMHDDLIDRVGFREVAVVGTELQLNGAAIKLRGFNRHEDHGLFGNAIPLQAMAHDLEIMRDLGANFVRTSHYPNDQRFLDLCDDLGFLVWEEHHARTIDFEHPKYREQIDVSTEEMVRWHGNHPSIIMWGFLNECDTVSESGAAEHRRMFALLRELDDSRPITYAANRYLRDTVVGCADIVSWNKYTGWYSGEPTLESIREECDKLINWSRENGGEGKPFIMSEFGAGAIYGCHDRNRAKWSEEFQADIMEHLLAVYLHHPNIIGAAIWQFCDVRVTKNWSLQRPRTMNNKGVVDEFRRPKLCYDVVREAFHRAAAGE